MFWEELYIRSLKVRSKMFELLYKYLILNKKASLPGLGIFIIERTPARLDFANRVFISPRYAISFLSQPSLNDNRMYGFISNEQQVDDPEAITRYYKFANDVKENLTKANAVEFPGMGILSQDANGEMSFKAITLTDQYFPPVASERVIRENAEHHILVGDLNRTNTQMKEMLVSDQDLSSGDKDYWWIFAIALGIISIAGIVYYYLHNGSLR